MKKKLFYRAISGSLYGGLAWLVAYFTIQPELFSVTTLICAAIGTTAGIALWSIIPTA